jgi:hypothetical protein
MTMPPFTKVKNAWHCISLFLCIFLSPRYRKIWTKRSRDRKDGIWPAGSIVRDRLAHFSDMHTEFTSLNYDLFPGHLCSLGLSSSSSVKLQYCVPFSSYELIWTCSSCLWFVCGSDLWKLCAPPPLSLKLFMECKLQATLPCKYTYGYWHNKKTGVEGLCNIA